MTEQNDLVTLVDEEGKEHNFVLLDILNVNDNDYAILLPTEPEFANSEPGGDEAIIFRIVETEEEHTLLAVEDEEEWETVAKAWEEINYDDGEEYDEDDEEEEEDEEL
ncbi:MAG: DUF1292 domain-containing protein [Dethiobacter sp.]|jgi:uncharacterized protein YrzB (UPF0473 family)|nr:DUF1292 domain-containing protein [Dethiobacter sp.]